MYKNGRISHWMEQADAKPATNSDLLPEVKQNLVIAGAGLTGLWTAYYAKKRFPNWKISIVEAQQVGYGASGRNGGWMSTLLPGNGSVYAKAAKKAGKDGQAEVSKLQRAVIDSIYEALDVMSAEGIDADQKQGGQVLYATIPAGLQRIARARKTALTLGYRAHEVQILNEDELSKEVSVDKAIGGIKYSHTVSLDPAKLCLGLRDSLLAMGVSIVERTRVEEIEKNLVKTDRGPIITEHIVSALESYTPEIADDFPGLGKSSLVPINSSMIVTNQLPQDVWNGLGWNQGQGLMDSSHTFIYAQRTADDRIAIGGRGSPYKFASGFSGDGQVDSHTVKGLKDKLHTMFPSVDFAVEHTWRGTLGVTRDWCAGIFYDPLNQIGAARGYAGHGITSTHLAGKTLVDRISGGQSELSKLVWNDHDSGRWEPEPLRWVGIHTMYRLLGIADDYEQKRNLDETSLLARFAGKIAGVAT